ncbi:hypothetical protein F5Y15DRAFT_414578 [Xylariaceae sp. FL0016]|nr:hypothetical protein F5Y15DRAFT_414578 [Xylariaceae sp. FL0016]
MSKRIGIADGLLFVALLLAVGQFSCLLSSDGQAIGNSQSDLSWETFDQALKVLYIAEILHLLAVMAAKVSVLAALLPITPINKHRVAIYATAVFTTAWGITSVFAVAFQCSAPRPWNLLDQSCMDILVFVQRIPLDERFLNKTWKIVVCEEVVQTLSIIATCIPFLKPFLTSLESGYLRADGVSRKIDLNRHGAHLKPSGWTPTYIRITGRNQRHWGSSVELRETSGPEDKI